MSDNIENCKTNPPKKGIIGNSRPQAGLRLLFAEFVTVRSSAKGRPIFSHLHGMSLFSYMFCQICFITFVENTTGATNCS